MLFRIRNFIWRVRAGIVLAPAARAVVLLCVAVFLVQQVAARTEFVRGYGYSFGDCLTYCFGLHGPLLARGFIWQPVTYMFLHGSLLHLLLNMFTVLFFGSGLEMEVGSRRFWRILLLGGAVGGLGWVLADACEPRLLAWLANGPAWGGMVTKVLHLHRVATGNGICIGASGGVFALIGAYAALFPRRETMVLMLFWPVTIRARTLAIVLGVVTVGEAIIGLGQVAYVAHLAGGVAGYVYGLRLRRHVG
jgi:membrane associated rhomboid family serine protease